MNQLHHWANGIARSQFLVGALLLANSTGLAAEWIQAHSGKTYNISGMALLAIQDGSTEFVVVHDNKKSDEPRLGIVASSPDKVQYRTLAWPSGTNLPIDLESVTSVPGYSGVFLALASDGRLYGLTIADDLVTVRTEFMLPDLPPGVNIEGFSVQRCGDQLLAVWGHRGAGQERGILFWGTLDLRVRRVTGVSKCEIVVPYPESSDPNTRHIADLKVDPNGVVWAAATSDPGDDGPFASAVYTLGVLRPGKSGIQFEPNNQLTRLWTCPRKIEALEFVAGSQGAIAFGTDDEHDGGWLYFQSTAAPRANVAAATKSQ